MAEQLWTWTAADLASAIRRREISAREAVASALDRIEALNPRLNALVLVLREEALAAADRADRATAAGEDTGTLHGVPVTTKVNVDQAGLPTTNGIVGLRDLVATEDSAPVAALKAAGAIVVGRSNTPAFSLRWFTDNDLHGRTLNPWDERVTPGGSSGGAGVAVATGMGAIGHGNDFGGSIRYPAYCNGIVGLRPTSGRVAAFNATAREERGIAAQLMSVQGPLTRTIGDARLALAAMAHPDPRDPLQVPAPLEGPPAPRRVALFAGAPGFQAETGVARALEDAARALRDAGYTVDEAAPPHFEEAAGLWRILVHDDMRRSVYPAMQKLGDAAVRTKYRHVFAGMGELDRDGYLDALARRMAIARAWSLFFERFPVLLMPISWRQALPIGADTESEESVEAVVRAQSPMLATAMLGLPGLAVPTGVVGGIPTGVQLAATRFREDLCLLAGEAIERALGHLTPPIPV